MQIGLGENKSMLKLSCLITIIMGRESHQYFAVSFLVHEVALDFFVGLPGD